MIFGNDAANNGGGIFLLNYESDPPSDSFVVSNCVIARDTSGMAGGSGIATTRNDLTILNTIVYDNVGEGRDQREIPPWKVSEQKRFLNLLQDEEKKSF